MKALFNITTVPFLYLKLQLLYIIKYPFFVQILNCFINVCVCVWDREREREREREGEKKWIRIQIRSMHCIWFMCLLGVWFSFKHIGFSLLSLLFPCDLLKKSSCLVEFLYMIKFPRCFLNIFSVFCISYRLVLHSRG